MTVYRPLVGFRIAEIAFCVFLIMCLMLLTMPVYSLYQKNARLLDQFLEFDALAMHLAIDSAYTGYPGVSNAYSEYLNELDLKYIENLRLDSRGHLTATVKCCENGFGNIDIGLGETIVLNRHTNPGPHQFSTTWLCPNFDGMGMVAELPLPKGSLPTEYTYFFCRAGLR